MTTNRFARFLVVGGIAALANILSRVALNLVMPFSVAVLLAYLVGMGTAFALAKAFVFEVSQRSTTSEGYRFAVVNAFALGVVWSVSVGLAEVVFPLLDFTWQADSVAHVIGVSSTAVTSYLGHKHWSFARLSTPTVAQN